MNYNTNNGLYFRFNNNTTDPYIMQCCINKNKRLLEKKFFENNLLCSWSSKISADFTGDMLYCKGIGEDSVKPSRINTIFSEASKDFQFPEYKEYENLCDLQSSPANIAKRITDSILSNRHKKLDKDNFEKELELIKQNIGNNFVNIKTFAASKNNSPPLFKQNKENIPDGTLAFMGCYQPALATDLRSMIVYKLLEKCYGNGETGTVYSYYRSKGDTYISFSSYAPEENIFYTGLLAGYNDNLYKDISKKIRDYKINEKLLDTFRKRFIDDLLFSAFQYGDSLAVLQYALHTGTETTVNDIINIINSITYDEITVASEKQKYSLKVGMQ